MNTVFGPAGNSESFGKISKASADAPKWLAQMGLDCYEYQCGRGVNIGDETAALIGKNAKENGILMSLHSPYFINLSSPDEERIAKSRSYIMQSCHAVKCMGGDRVVVHCGGLSGMAREDALRNSVSTLGLVLPEMEAAGYNDISLCIETMGKINVLGELSEVLEICKSDERLLPCIDFGHLNARTGGMMNSSDAFGALLDDIENALGHDRASRFHVHFSKIEYSKGGEVRHLTFDDSVFGPDFEPLGELLARRDLAPHIICESAGTQAEDALKMKRMYLAAKEKM